MILKLKKILTIIILFFITITQASNIPKYENDKKFKFKFPKLRRVLEAEDVDKVCARAESEVREFFANDSSSVSEVDYSDSSKYIDDLLNIIDGKGEGDQNDPIMSYVKRLLPMAFFIAFGIIAIILWPVSLCCLFCCKCCCCFCCCPKSINKIWKLVFFFLSGGCFVITFIMATYGLAATNKVFEGIDNTSCTIFKVVTETVDGQSKTTLPKWGGIGGIQTKFSQLSTTISNAQTSTVQQFNNAQNNLNLEKDQFETKLTQTSVSTSSKPVVDPTSNTLPSIEFIPLYVSNYGPKGTQDTMLSNIYYEYTTLTNGIMKSIDDASNNIHSAFSGNDLTTQLNEASEKINDIRDSFDKIEDSIASPWMKYQDYVYSYGKKYSKVVFGIIMGLSLGMTGIYTITFLNILQSLQCVFSIITTVVWNLLYLFSILSFLISGLLGVIGIIGKDGSSLANYLISSENLNSEDPRLFGQSSSIDYLNICINGDGNLKDKLNLGDAMDSLNNLLDLKDTLNSHISTLSNHKESTVIASFKSQNCGSQFLNENEICSFLRTDTTPQQKYDFNKWLEFLNKYTSKSQGNVQTGSFNYDEFWGTTNSKDGYTYLPFSASISTEQAAPNSKKLLNIYDAWTKEVVGFRYATSGATNAGSEYTTVQAAAVKVLESFSQLKDHINGATGFYKDVDSKNTDLNDKFKTVVNLMISTLQYAVSIIDSVNDVIGSLLGDGDSSIYAIINCSFIGGDFKFLIKQLHDSIGKNVYSFASTMITMTVFLAVALYSSIFYMVLVKKIRENEEKSE